MTKEENALYERVCSLKKERNYLLTVFNELDSLVRRGYDGPFMGEDVRDLFKSVIEYKKWRHDQQLSNCHAYGLCAVGDPYDFPCATCPAKKGE